MVAYMYSLILPGKKRKRNNVIKELIVNINCTKEPSGKVNKLITYTYCTLLFYLYYLG